MSKRTALRNQDMARKIEAMPERDRHAYALWLVHERNGEVVGEYETNGDVAWCFFINNGGPEADPYEHLSSGLDSPQDGDAVFYARRHNN